MTMLSSKQKSTVIINDRTWSQRLALGVVLGFCLIASAAVAADSGRPAHSYILTSQIKAIAGEDGSLEVLSSDLALPLLHGRLDPLADTRRRRGGSTAWKSLVSQSREGMPGGQRGFSAQADDDGDGAVDEDWLDGRDNDGDGQTDEDYAAISDAMTAVSISQGSGWAQLEFMQWAGTRLQNALFLNFSALHELSGATVPYYHLQSNGEPWQEMDVFSRHHNLTGQSITNEATAFVMRVENPASLGNLADPSALNTSGPSVFTWVGVLVLDQSDTQGYLRPQLENGTLSLPLTETPMATVIGTAASWMQLNRLLLDAVMVYEGVKDPVSQQQARWIVSPLCSLCRLEKTLDFTVQSDPEDDLTLRFTLEPGRSGLLDPDLFVVEGYPLGSPQTVVWEPVLGPKVFVSWALESGGLPSDLYGMLGEVLDHTAEGTLVYKFGNSAAGVSGILQAESEVELSGVWLDGRTFVSEGSIVHSNTGILGAAIGADENTSDPEKARTLEDHLSLSPKLLEGWPNPFRDQIRIEFVIPSSVRELFDWTEDELISESIELSAPVVWSSGQPSVSVKVYSINGQELVSLQQGNLGEGRYSVSWNGTDAFGRQVASGTYFCKLQLDDWSVTRRLVFIR